MTVSDILFAKAIEAPEDLKDMVMMGYLTEVDGEFLSLDKLLALHYTDLQSLSKAHERLLKL